MSSHAENAAVVMEHPAARAWASLTTAQSAPGDITCLRGKGDLRKKSRVYRLHGAGARAEDVIAKLCLKSTARLEQVVYEKFLGELAIDAPAFYGLTDDSDADYCWLFLQDVGDHKYSRSSQAHAALAAGWLGRLHASTQNLADADIPDRGPDDFLGHLRAGRARLAGQMSMDNLTSDDRDVLIRTIALLDATESTWDEIEARCRHLPRTLTHGDFKRGNVRVHTGIGGNRLVVLDWEMAGLGPPAIDMHAFLFDDFGSIARLPPSAYVEAVRDTWTGFDIRDIEEAAVAGAIFRQVVSIDWASQSFNSLSIERYVSRFEIYGTRLSEMLRLLERQG